MNTTRYTKDHEWVRQEGDIVVIIAGLFMMIMGVVGAAGEYRHGTITSTFQLVDRPTELAWTGKTLGIPAIHVYRLRPSDPRLGHTVVWTEESWSGLLARLLRRRFTTTLKTAIDTGLARLKAEAERRATP